MKSTIFIVILLFFTGCTVQLKNDKKLEGENIIQSEYEIYLGPQIGKK